MGGESMQVRLSSLYILTSQEDTHRAATLTHTPRDELRAVNIK